MVSLFDDEDEENQRRMRDRFMAPAPSGTNPFGASDPSLDPRMVGGFLSQRSRGADVAPAYPIPNRPKESPGSDAILPIIAAALGAGADAFANKGKNIGSIIGAVGSQALNSRENERARSDKMFENDRDAYLKQGEGEARNKQIELGGRNADMRQLEIDAQLAHERAVQTRFMAGLDSPEAKAADLAFKQAQTKHQLAMTSQAEAAAARGEDGLTAEQRERGKDRDADRDLRKSLGEQAAADRALKRDEMAAAAAEREDGKAAVARERSANTFRAKTEKTRPQLGRMDEIDSVLGNPKYKDDVPGVGPVDSRWPEWANSPDANKMKMAVADMSDMLVRQREGAVAPPAMYAVISRFVNAGPNATDAMFTQAYDAYKKILTEEIRQQGAGREDVAREVLGSHGDRIFGKQPPPAAAPPPPAAGDYDPMNNGLVPGEAALKTTVTTPNRRDVPPIPQAPPAPGGGGLQPEQVERMKRLGITLRAPGVY